jgi:hypothetical protein
MEDFLKLLTSGRTIRGTKPPKAKNGVFLSRRLIFRVGGKNKYFQNYWTKQLYFALSNK